MTHRLCCCVGDITCEEWCECLPATAVINTIEIQRTRRTYDYNNQTAFDYVETIRLQNVAMAFYTDGCRCWMPAQLTRMSSRPKRSTTRSTNPLRWDRSVKSAWK